MDNLILSLYNVLQNLYYTKYSYTVLLVVSALCFLSI